MSLTDQPPNVIEDPTSEEVRELQAAARDRWGEAWVLRQIHAATGNTQSAVIHSEGQTEDGHIKQVVLTYRDGAVYATRRVLRREVVESEDLGVVE